MIVSELLNDPLANEVYAAVAHVGDRKNALLDTDGYDSGTHAGLGGVLRGLFVNELISKLNGVRQIVGSPGNTLKLPANNSRIALSCFLSEIRDYRVNCDFARHLSRGLTAHAVTNHENSVTRVVAKVVFVFGANTADIGLGRYLGVQLHGSATWVVNTSLLYQDGQTAPKGLPRQPVPSDI